LRSDGCGNPSAPCGSRRIFNLWTDPYERADITSNTYYDWLLNHAFLLVPAQDYVGQFLAMLKDYPPRQKAASFNLDKVRCCSCCAPTTTVCRANTTAITVSGLTIFRGPMIEPGEYQAINVSKSHSLGRFSSQNIELVSKQEDFGFQRSPRPK
jgi:hypothetical protein